MKISLKNSNFISSGLGKHQGQLLEIKNDKTTIIQNFKIDSETVSDSKIIVDGFCNYFSNVGPEFANKITKSNQSPHH